MCDAQLYVCQSVSVLWDSGLLVLNCRTQQYLEIMRRCQGTNATFSRVKFDSEKKVLLGTSDVNV